MFIFNVSVPVILLLMLVVNVLLIFLGRELKKAYVTAFALFLNLVLVLMHTIQYLTLTKENLLIYGDTLTSCLLIDFVLILVSFFAYLWIDDIDTRFHKKKSIDNSLDWFWKNV